MTDGPTGFHWQRFKPRSIQLPENLTASQLDGCACIHCGAEDQPMRPVEAWSELSSQLFECTAFDACEQRIAGSTEAAAEYAAEQDRTILE